MEGKELFNPIEVKFYDFSHFEYYALIVAENIEDDKIALIICMRNAISMDERLNSLFKDIPFVVKEVK